MAQIVCLCGSVRFKDDFMREACRFSMEGWIVVMPNCFRHDYFHDTRSGQVYKKELDELHFAKIRMADLVFIINKDGYMGYSTTREFNYAVGLEKDIDFMEGV